MRYVCVTCKVEKDASEFYSDKRNTVKGVKAACKVCCKAWQNAHRLPYSESDRKRSKDWRDKNLAHCHKLEQERRDRNIESYRASCRRWARENLHVKAERRALEKNSVPVWAERDKIKTVYQKARVFGMTVDHVVPLKHPLVCGLHVWNNLQLLDKGMNSTKRNYCWPDMPEAMTT